MNIQLTRSGGMLGKALQASGQFDVDEESITEQIKSLAPVENKGARDSFYYSLVINDEETYKIDITKATGEIKRIIDTLEENLHI